jgi:hypothetical protein
VAQPLSLIHSICHPQRAAAPSAHPVAAAGQRAAVAACGAPQPRRGLGAAVGPPPPRLEVVQVRRLRPPLAPRLPLADARAAGKKGFCKGFAKNFAGNQAATCSTDRGWQEGTAALRAFKCSTGLWPGERLRSPGHAAVVNQSRVATSLPEDKGAEGACMAAACRPEVMKQRGKTSVSNKR